jgi:hypothetical protein
MRVTTGGGNLTDGAKAVIFALALDFTPRDWVPSSKQSEEEKKNS